MFNQSDSIKFSHWRHQKGAFQKLISSVLKSYHWTKNSTKGIGWQCCRVFSGQKPSNSLTISTNWGLQWWMAERTAVSGRGTELRPLLSLRPAEALGQQWQQKLLLLNNFFFFKLRQFMHNLCVCTCACLCVCVHVCVHSCCMHWILTLCICKECVSA